MFTWCCTTLTGLWFTNTNVFTIGVKLARLLHKTTGYNLQHKTMCKSSVVVLIQ